MTIEGHADVRGPDRFNDWLSEERAERVRTVLVELGMPADKIDTKGYGRKRPRDPETTPEAHQQNRRVEFVISSGGGKSASSTSTSTSTSTKAEERWRPRFRRRRCLRRR
jgi:hypothetical protein